MLVADSGVKNEIFRIRQLVQICNTIEYLYNYTKGTNWVSDYQICTVLKNSFLKLRSQ